MRIFVRLEVFESIKEVGEIRKLREAAAVQLDKIRKSGKLELGIVAADGRLPMMLLNVDSAAELMDLLGNVFIDHFKIESHPVVSFDELGKFFAAHPPE